MRKVWISGEKECLGAEKPCCHCQWNSRCEIVQSLPDSIREKTRQLILHADHDKAMHSFTVKVRLEKQGMLGSFSRPPLSDKDALNHS